MSEWAEWVETLWGFIIVSKYAKIYPKDGASSPDFQWRFCQKSSSIFPGFTGCCHTRIVETYQIVINSSLPIHLSSGKVTIVLVRNSV